MSPWKRYRKTAVTEMMPWSEDLLSVVMERVSISPADRKAGSPKLGDMIARNPDNHDDRWLVSAEYFANYELAEPETERAKLQQEHDDLARALFEIRTLTIRGKGDPQVAAIACKALLPIDESPLHADSPSPTS